LGVVFGVAGQGNHFSQWSQASDQFTTDLTLGTQNQQSWKLTIF
jgi:hypothetical protein